MQINLVSLARGRAKGSHEGDKGLRGITMSDGLEAGRNVNTKTGRGSQSQWAATTTTKQGITSG